MKKALILLLIFAIAFSDPPTKYIVSNAENSSFNGEYLLTELTFDYNPVYSKDNSYYLWNQGCFARWSLADDNPFNYPCPNYSNGTVADLPPSNGYVVGGEASGSASSITIAAGEEAAPIELADFILSQENGSVYINWQTASETENNGYAIQRKIDDEAWESIVDYHSDPSLEGKGTTSERHNYTWIDENVEPGIRYKYRLGDVDFSNVITWHDAQEITILEEDNQMPTEFGLQSAFPSPFNPTLTIRYGLTDDAQTSVKILDLSGKTIATLSDQHQKAGSYELQWHAESTSSGLYIVKVTSGDKNDIRKVLLTK